MYMHLKSAGVFLMDLSAFCWAIDTLVALLKDPTYTGHPGNFPHFH